MSKLKSYKAKYTGGPFRPLQVKLGLNDDSVIEVEYTQYDVYLSRASTNASGKQKLIPNFKICISLILITVCIKKGSSPKIVLETTYQVIVFHICLLEKMHTIILTLTQNITHIQSFLGKKVKIKNTTFLQCYLLIQQQCQCYLLNYQDQSQFLT